MQLRHVRQPETAREHEMAKYAIKAHNAYFVSGAYLRMGLSLVFYAMIAPWFSDTVLTIWHAIVFVMMSAIIESVTFFRSYKRAERLATLYQGCTSSFRLFHAKYTTEI